MIENDPAGYWYKKDDGQFVLIHGKDEPENIVYGCEKVAIGYSGITTGEYKLHKHGRPDLVQKWFSNKGKELRETGAPLDFADYCLLESELFKVEDLNRLIGEPEYVKEFIENFNAGLINGLKHTIDHEKRGDTQLGG